MLDVDSAGGGTPTGRAGRAGLPTAHLALLAVAVVSSCVLVAVAPRHSAFAVVCALLATLGCGGVTVLERRAPRLGGRTVALAVGVVMLVAVVTPPRTSNDLWSYGTYGRMVAVHDADPYTATPAQFPRDPFARRVSPMWRHRSSVYGPLWVGVATADAALVGTSTLANRLFFQLLAALAAAVVLAVVWRRTRSAAALAWLGLHPVFTAIAVNNGHADVLIGLAVLAAALLAVRRRVLVAGVLIGLVALIKVTALLALLGVAFWLWRSRSRRDALVCAGGALGTVAVGYGAVLGVAEHVLANADHTITAASPWNGLADLLVGHDAGRALAHPLAYNATLDTVFFAGAGLVVVLAVVLGWRAARVGAAEAAGTAAAAYPVAAAYSYPWYSAWALPALAADGPTALGWVVWLQAAAALVVLKLATFSSGTLDDQVARVLLTDLAPVALLAAFVAAGLPLTKLRRKVPV